MLVQTLPDTMSKLAQVGDATIYEPAGDQPQQERRHAQYQSRSLAECITNVSTPRGKLPVLKAMLTTACEMNCHYCPFRAGRSKMKRMTFSPGIIKGSVTTQDKIIDTAEIVRKRYNYNGYRNWCLKI